MQNIHPYFVHFPIAILSIGLLWDLLGIILKKESLMNAGWWAQLFGTVAIVVTGITGLIAANKIAHSEAAHEIMETHETIGLIVAGVFILLFIWRSFLKTALPTQILQQIVYLLIAGLAVLTMLYGAHLGGKLVYEFGVGGSAVPQVRSSEDHHDAQESTAPDHDHENQHNEHEETKHPH